jgi:23S rRNA (pseudouridine1915-N3)-methyltransferase
MKTEFWMIGKTHHDYLNPGIEKYEKRIKHFISFSIQEIKTCKVKSASESIKQEGDKVMKLLQPTDSLILLDEKGKSFSSHQMADYLQKQFNTSQSKLVFLIGGAYGFGEDIYARAQDKISLSPMTFPHDLVRIIFLEQMYRALTIIRNHPYQH